MKALILLAYLTLEFTAAIAQKQYQTAIKMTSTTTDNADLLNLLRFQEVHLHKIHFRGESLVGKHYTIVVKEMWNGELKRTDTLINTRKKGMKELRADSLNLRVIGSKSADKKLKVMFFFPEFAVQREFDATYA